MVQILKPVEIVTKQGECAISIILELNINLNSNGLSITNNIPIVKEKIEDKKEEENNWIIPDFDNNTKIKFGKKI